MKMVNSDGTAFKIPTKKGHIEKLKANGWTEVKAKKKRQKKVASEEKTEQEQAGE